MTDMTPEQQAELMAAAIAPQPIPASIDVAATEGGQPHVVLRVVDATGIRYVFLQPDPALEIAEKIRVTARQAKTGLIVTGPGLAVPRG